MKKKQRTMYRVKNESDGTSIDVLATNRANAMHLARRKTGWVNKKSDAEGYFGYTIREVE